MIKWSYYLLQLILFFLMALNANNNWMYVAMSAVYISTLILAIADHRKNVLDINPF